MRNYYREEVDNVYDNASDGKPFKYMAKITGKTEERPAQGQNEGCTNQPPPDPVPTLNIEVTIPLKYLRNSWRSLDLPLIIVKYNLIYHEQKTM